MTNSQTNIEFLGGATRVACPTSDLAWLREFFQPSFTFDSAAPVREDLQLSIDAARFADWRQRADWNGCPRFDCFTLDGSFEQFPGLEAADGSRTLWLDRFGTFLFVSAGRDRFELLSDSDQLGNRLALMRVVRELATVRAIKQGAIPFHGAACGIEGAAVAFVGSKTAGKTTALAHCLQSPRFQFLANDRFFLYDGPGGPQIAGIPTIVKVRWGTLRLFPELERQTLAHPFHRQRTLREVFEQGGRASRTDEAASFSQAQFLHLTNSRAISAAPLGSFLFLERDDSVYIPRLLPIAIDTAAERLRQSLLSPGVLLQTASVFDAAPNRTVDEERLRSACRNLAAHGFCWRYQQGIRTISQPALPQLSFRAA